MPITISSGQRHAPRQKHLPPSSPLHLWPTPLRFYASRPSTRAPNSQRKSQPEPYRPRPFQVKPPPTLETLPPNTRNPSRLNIPTTPHPAPKPLHPLDAAKVRLGYDAVARRILLAMVATPIALVTSWMLWERVVLGKARAQVVGKGGEEMKTGPGQGVGGLMGERSWEGGEEELGEKEAVGERG